MLDTKKEESGYVVIKRGVKLGKLLENLGTSEKMDFEFALMKLPHLLGQNIKLEESELTKQKFDIINKNEDNLAFCEVKIKVYSGCTAGRIELMEKFNKFTKLIIGQQSFRNCIENSGIKNVFLIGENFTLGYVKSLVGG